MQLIHLKYDRSGFSLIELMMVISITGMIAIFAVPNYTKTVNRTSERQDVNNLMMIRTAHFLLYNTGANIGPANRDLDTVAMNALNNGGINQLFGLSIQAADGETFSYKKGAPSTTPDFEACTMRPGYFKICIDHNPISATNPGCNRQGAYASKPCPSLANR